MDRSKVLEPQLAHVLDEIRRMEDELAAGSLTVPGSKGQPMPNRLLAELRAHRWLLVRLADSVNPDMAAARVPDTVDQLRREWVTSGASM
jgi:hypothetical protein